MPKRSSRLRRLRRVALLIETTRSYTRDLLLGVRRYLAEHGPWSTFLELRSLDSSPPPWLRTWDGDGILTRTFTTETADAIAATGLPTVELRSTRFHPHVPFVGMDNAHIGHLVAEHFLERGYRQFAVYALDSEPYFTERVENFRATIAKAGYLCTVLPQRGGDGVRDWEQTQRALMTWLKGLPKPIGIFAANDQLGVRLLDACQRAGIAVPEAVAVVGTEDEQTLCTFASPPLTSVRFDGATVGWRAAQLLDRLMAGGKAPASETLIPPPGIRVRASSDALVITDALVADAARLIREHAHEGIGVEQVCRQLTVSRSTLERRITAALGRTPKEEIQRVRFRAIEQLLSDTDLFMAAIATRTGFATTHHLHAAFKERHGRTPGAFRRLRGG
ncbi:MAG TPA: DNA-binding transcriptional regulator [Planctomycetota bacterium]|nr:DNA-binding transcriptional regulator [Planctomycetota bacterium]